MFYFQKEYQNILLLSTFILVFELCSCTGLGPTSDEPQSSWPSPFKAIWNVPTYNCFHHFGVDLGLAKFDILANKEEQKTGDEIVIFYKPQLGLYPYYDPTTLHPVNGGLPQLVDLYQHLEKATEDVIAAVPNKDFSGIGIIDWEYWRPQWEMNWDSREIYKNKSLEVVRARNPHWDSERVELVARLEFEQAAKSLMDSTLRLVKELRPMGHWGFYHFPYCDNVKNPNGTCNPVSVLSNNNITWLFDSSTALYPSIYFNGFQKDKRDNAMFKLMETFRVRNMSRHQDLPIYVYTRFNYSHSSLYYPKTDLKNSILLAAELGCDGVVFWGDHNDSRSLQACQELQSYVNSTLGPFVKGVTEAATLCSQRVCSGRGRCVGNIMACSDNFKNQDGWSNAYIGPQHSGQKACRCSCYKGWQGTACNKKNK